jgi:hypothetical protein
MLMSLNVCKLVPSSRQNDLQNPINMISFLGLLTTTNKSEQVKCVKILYTNISVKNLLWCRWVWCIELVDNSCWKFCITYLQIVTSNQRWKEFIIFSNDLQHHHIENNIGIQFYHIQNLENMEQKSIINICQILNDLQYLILLIPNTL